MSNWQLEHYDPFAKKSAGPVETHTLQATSAPQPGQLTNNNLLWFLGCFLFVPAGICVYVYFNVPVLNAPQSSILIPAGVFGALGVLVLGLAATGVGTGHVVALAGSPLHQKGDYKTALARLQGATNGFAFPTGGSLRFFHARYRASKWELAQRIYRIYLTDNEWLFISLHTGTLDRAKSAAGVRAASARGGLAGGTAAWGEMKSWEQHEERLKALNPVRDLDALRKFADEDPESFRLPVEGIHDVRIEKPSFWAKLDRPGEMLAKICLVHPTRGKMVLDIAYPDDLTTVSDEIPKRVDDDGKIIAS
jgi:hypothetical protein